LVTGAFLAVAAFLAAAAFFAAAGSDVAAADPPLVAGSFLDDSFFAVTMVELLVPPRGGSLTD
jgi:hypothetical protein